MLLIKTSTTRRGRLSTEVTDGSWVRISRILTCACRFFVGKAQKLSEPLQSVKSLLTRPYNQLNRCEHARPAHVGPSQFRRAEDGPLSLRGRGPSRWRLQVFSKCFEWTANGLRNPSKRTERSLNFRTEMSQHFI